jgi:hypothetical protein
MPLNEIPKYLTPEVRSLIEAALEDAWAGAKQGRHNRIEAAPAQKS